MFMRHTIGMKHYTMLAMAMFVPGALFASDSPFDQLVAEAGTDKLALYIPSVPRPVPPEEEDIPQYIPPDNDQPGFSWEEVKRRVPGDYIVTGDKGASFSTDLSGNGKDGESFTLPPKTLYKLQAALVFEADKIKVELKQPAPGHARKNGYVRLNSIADSSAGGFNDLPPTAKAFLDMLAYAEGTHGAYNLRYGHKSFDSYLHHPRHSICKGKYCSSAAGRYQFLYKTWKRLVRKLHLKDFSPPSQDKAAMELIRRVGAYQAVINSDQESEFRYAVRKVRNIWPSLPGSRCGQTRKSMSALWLIYNKSLAKYR
jgi:muramidase (phage lysozyme)